MRLLRIAKSHLRQAEVEDRFPGWFRAEIDFLRESSKILAKRREISLYGGEEAFLTPEDIISKGDAEDAVGRAAKTHIMQEAHR